VSSAWKFVSRHNQHFPGKISLRNASPDVRNLQNDCTAHIGNLPNDKMSYATNSWLPAGPVYNDIQHLNLFSHTAELLTPTISISDDTKWHNPEKRQSKYAAASQRLVRIL